jgi:predicted Zn finger-like uncharacterized protein
MRIDCDSCGAAYAIDDSLITARGVRAQCPKCGNQKVVKKDASGAVASPFSGPPKQPTPFGTPGPTPTPFGTPNPFGPPPTSAGGGAAAGPAANPFGAPAGGGSPFGTPPGGNPSPFGPPGGEAPAASPFGPPPTGGGGGPGPSPAANPFGAPPGPAPAPAPAANPFAAPGAPAGGGADPFGAPAEPASPFGADAGAGDANPFGAPPGGAESPFGAPGGDAPASPFAAPPQQPAEAPDPFGDMTSNPSGGAADIGLGGGDDGRFAPPQKDADVPLETEREEKWQIRKDGQLSSDLDLADVRRMIRSGELKGADLAAPVGEPLTRIDQSPVLKVSLTTGKKSPAKVVKGARASRGGGGGGGLGTGAKAGLLVAALAAAVVVVYVVDPTLFKFSSGDTSKNPFARAEKQWSLEFPQADGLASEHVVEGVKLMRLDTADGHRRADEHFRIALLNDPKNMEAIAGYVENFSYLPNVRADAGGAALALDGVNWALAREPKSADLLRAKASLRMAMGDAGGFDEALEIIREAQAEKPDDPTLNLVLARIHLDRSPQKALALAGKVAASNTDLKQATIILGGAHRRVGEFSQAKKLLEERLKSDPTNVSALRELAALELDLGDMRSAIKRLDQLIAAEERDIEAHLMRAKIRYQMLGEPKKAAEELQFVVDNYEKAAGDLNRPLLVHLGFVRGLLLGDPDTGIQLVEKARQRDSAYTPSLFVLGQLYGAKGEWDSAIENLTRAEAALRDSLTGANALVLLGDAEARAGKMQAAVSHMSEAIELAPRDPKGYFALASTHMNQKQSSSAFTVMRKALNIDPLASSARRALTDYPEPIADLERYASSLATAKVKPAERPLARAAEGVIHFHAGNPKKARGLMDKSLKADRNNHAALLYLGVMELNRSSRKSKAFLNRAQKTTGGTHTMTRVYLARALMALDEDKEADKLVTAVIDDEESNLQARTLKAELMIKSKDLGGGRAELRRVLRDAPDYQPVKALLAKHE